jgi:hypothetical protein
MVALGFAALLVLCSLVALGAGENRNNPRVRAQSAQKPAVQKSPAQKPPDKNQQGPNTFDRIAYYVPSRIADFLDLWKFNGAIGPGIAINLRPTKSLQAGLGAYYATRFGLRGRRYPVWYEESSEGGFDGMYYEGGTTERGFYEFGGTIHFILIGFEMAFDIEEALDFGYGLFMSDPMDDDFR